MNVQVKITPTTIIDVNGETPQEVFERLARLEEVFGLSECGACKGKDLRHIVREQSGYKFFELQCQNKDCRARLAFGQPKAVKGGLFPQRKDKGGAWKANGGWERYQPNKPEGAGDAYEGEQEPF